MYNNDISQMQDQSQFLPNLNSSQITRRKAKRSIISRHLQSTNFFNSTKNYCYTRPQSKYDKSVITKNTKMDDSASQMVFYHRSNMDNVKVKGKSTTNLSTRKMYRDFHPDTQNIMNSYVDHLDKKFTIGGTFDVDSLNDPYQKSNPLLNNCKMTPTLFNMVEKQKSVKSGLNYNPLNYNFVDSDDEIDEEEENKYIDKMLNESLEDEEEPLDGFPKQVIGEKACKDYYAHYKKLERIEDQNDKFNITGSMFTKMQRGLSDKLFPPLK